MAQEYKCLQRAQNTNHKEHENYHQNRASPCPCQKGYHRINLKHKIKACKYMTKGTCINYCWTSNLASQYIKQYEISFKKLKVVLIHNIQWSDDWVYDHK